MTVPGNPLMTFLRLAVLTLGALVMLFPFFFMISTSLKPQSEVFSSGLSLIPQHWAFVENYTKAVTRIPMLQILGNGLIVCVAIVFFQILFAFPLPMLWRS